MKRPIEITLQPGFFLYLSAMVLLLPLPWLLGAIFAAVLHELAHLAVLKLLRIPVQQLVISHGGAVIHTAPMRPYQEFFSAAAGPAAGLLLTSLFPVWPQLAVCGFVQSLFNLLPLLPFDGGRLFLCGTKMLFGDRSGSKVYSITEKLAYILLGIGIIIGFKIRTFLLTALLILTLSKIKNCHVNT